MEKLKVENLAKNQVIILNGKEESFQSYDTIIALKKKDKVYLDPKWNYSRTTTKYLNQFLGTNGKKEIEKKIKEKEYIIKSLN